jgi:hypothetical protein
MSDIPPPNIVRHPRRLGFIGFNAIVLVLVGIWLLTRSDNAEAGLAGLPNVALSTAAIIVLVAVWAATWIAWGSMVWSRHRKARGR